jgi:hypothetical protein
MSEFDQKQIPDLVEYEISFEEWLGLDEAGRDKVKDALHRGLLSARETFPLFLSLEKHVTFALQRFDQQYGRLPGLTILGADFSIDLEFYIYVEHSLFF